MNNNKMEFDFLNDNTQQQEKKKKDCKNILLSIAVIISWILYIFIYFICGFITFFAVILFGISIVPKKRKKRWF